MAGKDEQYCAVCKKPLRNLICYNCNGRGYLRWQLVSGSRGLKRTCWACGGRGTRLRCPDERQHIWKDFLSPGGRGIYTGPKKLRLPIRGYTGARKPGLPARDYRGPKKPKFVTVSDLIRERKVPPPNHPYWKRTIPAWDPRYPKAWHPNHPRNPFRRK